MADNPQYVLLDFENVQPKALDRLRPGTARIKVFLGQHQTKLMVELVQRLQPFGADVEYIQIQGSGPDAVDFHIAYYIGRLAVTEPSASFTIVSKDRGFDPLVRHLAQRGVSCRRLSELPPLAAATPEKVTPPLKSSTPDPSAPALAASAQSARNRTAPKPAVATSARARAANVVAHLRKSTKPAKLTTLRSTIKALFKPPLDDRSVDAIVQSLKDSKRLSVVGDKVTYSLG